MDETVKSNIVLIGMPGAGKSTVGVVLAKILNYAFVDADLVIQQRHGQTLQNLIDSLGSEGFIALENEALCAIDGERAIISTGGSAIYSPEAMDHLSRIGTIVYLKVGIDELERRLEDFSERGVVMQDGRSVTLAALFDERAPLYEKYADVVVDMDGLTITGSAKAICEALKK